MTFNLRTTSFVSWLVALGAANQTAALVRLDEAGGVPLQFKAGGLDYFLEVDLIREDVLGEWVDRLNTAQRFSVVLHYAEYDAWPEWFHALTQGSPSRGI